MPNFNAYDKLDNEFDVTFPTLSDASGKPGEIPLMSMAWRHKETSPVQK